MMNSLWDILSVAIGISFVFMILSIMNSWVQESIASFFDLRAKNLADVLQNLLEPAAQTLNGMARANTDFKRPADPSGGGLISQLLQKGGKKLKQVSGKRNGALHRIGESLDQLGESAEQVNKRMAGMRSKQAHVTQLENQNEKTKNGICGLLSENPVRTLYMHPVVYSLSKPKELPDHLPTDDFTVALLDLLDDAGRGAEGKRSPSSKITMANIKRGIQELEDSENNELGYRLRSLLYTAQMNAQGKAQAGIDEFRQAVGSWFDDTVNRGKVWYKRRMRRIGIASGIILAVVLNADTIGLSNALWHNAVLRESIAQAAEASSKDGQDALNSERAQENLQQLMDLGLPLDWSFEIDPNNPHAFPGTSDAIALKAIGLIITGFAISQGSQLWFDLMNRLIDLRSSGLQPDAEEPPAKEKSK
jgi:hypothetical protein